MKNEINELKLKLKKHDELTSLTKKLVDTISKECDENDVGYEIMNMVDNLKANQLIIFAKNP